MRCTPGCFGQLFYYCRVWLHGSVREGSVHTARCAVTRAATRGDRRMNLIGVSLATSSGTVLVPFHEEIFCGFAQPPMP